MAVDPPRPAPDASDPRRGIPPVDVVLRDPAVVDHVALLGRQRALGVAQEVLSRARDGALPPAEVVDEVATRLGELVAAPGTRPVLNATGVVVHTNLGRAPLGEAATAALVAAAGYADIELDLATGRRGRRGGSVVDALLRAVPEAQDALVVNNGAAALLLAMTALAAGREVVVSRGELVEIGDGFRLTDLVESSGARLREVGTTNRTHRGDYERALADRAAGVPAEPGPDRAAGPRPDVAALLKVHPGNYRVTGFTSAVPVAELARVARAADLPLVVDTGSGLLEPDPALPDEPDARTALRDGAGLVVASADKLLGGPQAGLVLGDADLVARLRRHPVARALRVDKLTLAALGATLRDPHPAPVTVARRAEPDHLRTRAESLREVLARQGLAAEVVPHDGRVGGGGAPGVPLAGWALALSEGLAGPLRLGDPAVLARVHDGRCLLDPRCVPPAQDAVLARAVLAAAGRPPAGGDTGTPTGGRPAR
ncbi:L-selenocysteinyl-tRNA(Sec) synthase [Serinicoccus chungangensis]|uniref:L-seryl-tRNA(Sec) selenium transferase n=1 Tax=Serinicoccus chungangensis TaxID=767452 RepID=A0A0W8I8I4_9MICO|nr:L-seryl-tRNA(Sec) selenium transferase [Serinicoccus chungangensis]KUG55704.1 L-selenocysteinyl-tRNA(Sec) synthase [Serinicoccus chungangensis]